MMKVDITSLRGAKWGFFDKEKIDPNYQLVLTQSVIGESNHQVIRIRVRDLVLILREVMYRMYQDALCITLILVAGLTAECR